MPIYLGNQNVLLRNGGGGSGNTNDATSIPTADMTAAFDSTAHMNSEDMTSQEVDDFVDGLDAQGGEPC